MVRAGSRGIQGLRGYRISVRVTVPRGETLSLAGPADVDSAYQIFLNGHLVGGDGDFSRTPPKVISIQPHLFFLPRADWVVSGDQWSGVIAIRVWCRVAPPPDGGGIHIAPILGLAKAVEAQYRLQWLEKFEGYIVDVTEAVAFLLLAVMALSLTPFDPKDGFFPWLAVSLVLISAARMNQAIYFWGQSETVTDYVVFRYVFVEPLMLGAWTVTWRACLDLRASAWIGRAALALTVLCMIAQLLSLSMLSSVVPHIVGLISGYALASARIGFLLLLIYIVCRALLAGTSGTWLAVLALVLVSVGLFAQELSAIGVPGIWFPFGVGVSRTEYAYAAFDVVLFAYLLRRLWSFAPRQKLSQKT
jgi:hypothetical protein